MKKNPKEITSASYSNGLSYFFLGHGFCPSCGGSLEFPCLSLLLVIGTSVFLMLGGLSALPRIGISLNWTWRFCFKLCSLGIDRLLPISLF